MAEYPTCPTCGAALTTPMELDEGVCRVCRNE